MTKRPGAVRATGLMMAALGIGGCMIGPNYQPPEPTVHDGWIETGDEEITRTPAELREWWTQFGDPVLDDLVERASDANLSLEIAGLRVLQARAALGISVGLFFPQLQRMNAGYSWNQLSEETPGIQDLATLPIFDRDFSLWSAGFDTGWELDVWGRYRRGIRSADADLVAAVSTYDDALVSITAEVARVYVLIRTLQQRLTYLEENARLQRRTLRVASVKFDNGEVSELDVAQVRALYEETRSQIPIVEAGIAQARHGLAVLLGATPDELPAELAERRPIPEAPTEVAIGIPADLLLRRPDLRAAERAAAAQSERVGVTETALYPRLFLLGRVGIAAEDFGDMWKDGAVFGSVGPSIDWAILNYGRIRNSIRVQDALLQQALTSYENRVLLALREVEDAKIGYARTRDQHERLADAVKASKRSTDIANLQYREGILELTRVLQTQGFLVRQQGLLAQAHGQVAIELIGLYKALGGGWENRAGEEFVPQDTIDEMRERTNWGDVIGADAPGPAKTHDADDVEGDDDGWFRWPLW